MTIRSNFYDDIQKYGSDIAYLRLMIQYGFIESTTDLTALSKDSKKLLDLNKKISDLIETRAKLMKELGGINPSEIRKLLNKQRIKHVREIREQKKKERERNIEKKRKKYKEYLKKHIVHVGRGYSNSLRRDDEKKELNEIYSLPIIKDENGLAKKLGISLSELKWLTYHRDATKISHYHSFEIPKKTGGTRKISAPKKKIKKAQKWIFDNILEKMDFTENAHGFIKGKSVLTNAKNHINKEFVINIDLKDFFPSITFGRILGLFKGLGYSSYVSTLLALLCTESDRRVLTVDENTYHVAISERKLPQGACTSPPLSNMICKRLDKRLAILCKNNNIDYTRYADDMTFSFDDRKKVGLVFSLAKKIVSEEGFKLNDKKTRIFSKSNRQEVTGIVTNEKSNVSRRWVNQLRLELFQYQKAKEKKIDPPVPLNVLKGKISYLKMVNKEKGKKYSNLLTL